MDALSRYRNAPLRSLQDEVNRLFETVFPGRLDDEDGRTMSAVWSPRMDLAETDGAFELSVDLPGLSREDVSLHLEDNRLVISGERREKKETKDRNVIRMERTFGPFYRSLPLPKSVKEGDVKAAFKDGVLTVTIPKTETKPPTKIEIK